MSRLILKGKSGQVNKDTTYQHTMQNRTQSEGLCADPTKEGCAHRWSTSHIDCLWSSFHLTICDTERDKVCEWWKINYYLHAAVKFGNGKAPTKISVIFKLAFSYKMMGSKKFVYTNIYHQTIIPNFTAAWKLASIFPWLYGMLLHVIKVPETHNYFCCNTTLAKNHLGKHISSFYPYFTPINQPGRLACQCLKTLATRFTYSHFSSFVYTWQSKDYMFVGARLSAVVGKVPKQV